MAGYVMIGVVVVLIAAFTFALNSRTLGERGWIYNRYNPRPTKVGTLGLLEEIYQPSIRHVIEERSSQKARGSQDDSGDGFDPDDEDESSVPLPHS